MPALECVGHRAVEHPDRVLLPVGLNGNGEDAVEAQRGKTAAERGVISGVLICCRQTHCAGGNALCGEGGRLYSIGVGDVGQPQIRGGHSQRKSKAHDHDAERQHTGRDCAGAVRQCFFQFDGSDTRQLLSFYILEYAADNPSAVRSRRRSSPVPGPQGMRHFTSFLVKFRRCNVCWYVERGLF